MKKRLAEWGDLTRLLPDADALLKASDDATRIRRLSLELHAKTGEATVSTASISKILPEYSTSKPQIVAKIRDSCRTYLGRQLTDRLFLNQPIERVSHRQTVHTIVVTKLQGELAAVLADVFTSALFQRPMSVESVAGRLGSIWHTIVAPLVDGERRAITAEAHDLGLLMLELSKVQVAAKRNGVEAAHDALGGVVRTCHATIRRLRDSNWATARPLLFPETALEKRAVFAEWLAQRESAVDSLRLALLDDHRTLARVSAASASAGVWHGLELVERLDDPIHGFLVQPPVHIGCFGTDSGRVYAQFLPERPWGLVAVQVFTVVRMLLQRHWLTTDALSVSFARSLVGDLLFEYDHRLQRASDEMADAVFREIGVEISAGKACALARAILDASERPPTTPAPTVPTARTSPTREVDSTRPTGTDARAEPAASAASAASVSWPGDPAAVDTIVLMRDRSFLPNPRHVHWVQLVDFLTLVGFANRIAQVLDKRARTVEHQLTHHVVIDTDVIVASVQQTLTTLTSEPELTPLRCLYRNLSMRPKLDLRVCAILKKLTACVQKSHATEAAKGIHAFELFFEYESERPKEQKSLRFDRVANTSSLYFVNGVVTRVLGFLSEGWPLPPSISWPLAKLPRLPTEAQR